jgi:hypothetical protein
LIRSSFPLLKIFKFYFQFDVSSSNNIEEVTSSFCTPFYVHEHNWFSRCEISGGYGILYSLPFPYHTYLFFKDSLGKKMSTSSNNFHKNMFVNVKTLQIYYKSSQPDENFDKSEVINLELSAYFESNKWIHLLFKLRHLELNILTEISPQNFLHLLNNTPCLNSLMAEKRILQRVTEHWNNVSICNHLSSKIRTLKLGGHVPRSRSISRHEIEQITTIFSKCEHLSLCVQSSNDTTGFILQNMSRLHSLHVNICGKAGPSIDMKWLEKEQTIFNASNCIIVINKHDHYFWLGKHP